MNYQMKMNIYHHTPIFVQNMICTYIGWTYNKIRYGRNFDTFTRFYSESAKWSEGELKEFQREKVSELIRHCFLTVPYYREKWISMGLTPGDFKNLEDISKLPYTTKEDVYENLTQMISDTSNKKELFVSMTGGSTGMPLTRYFTRKELQQHYAIFWNRMRQGVSRGDRYATFQVRDVVPSSQKKPPFWRENLAANQRFYSMRHLSQDKLKYYAESLTGEPFIYYQGIVSIMSVVAEYMQQNNFPLAHPPKAVFVTSEQLSPLTRNLFEKTWKTKVWNEYGQTECCAMIRQCEYGNHHPQMDYGFIEYEPIEYDDEGRLLAEIVCTGFIPFASPLIRYRIGDQVLLDNNRICPCGAPGPVIKEIRGRMSGYIVTPDGRKYSCLHGLDGILRHVRRTQIVQENKDEITIRVVPFPQFDKKDEQYLIMKFKEKIGCNLNITVETVKELERTKGGKVLSIINRIPNDC
jgi:phenylacetate-CoA ligase